MSLDRQAPNPDMLVLARESRELTQRELARKATLSQAAVSKIEAGLIRPSDDALTAIGGVLHYPIQFFSQRTPLVGLGSGELFHRRHLTIPSRVFARVRAQVAIRRLHLITLLRSVDVEGVRVPRLDVEEFDGHPQLVARAVRAYWQLPPGPVKNVTELLESSGIVVIADDFGTPLMDATSMWSPGMPPIIVINQQIPTDRYRFTLSHELGHLVMHSDVADPSAEEQANDFASEFLMPDQDIVHMLDRLSLERLTVLKEYWRVSMGALLKKAMSSGQISSRKYRELWTRMGAAGYRRHEPIPLPPERPALVRRILQAHQTALGYSLSELGQVLNMEQDEVREWYDIGHQDQLALFDDTHVVLPTDTGERQPHHLHVLK